MSKTNQELVYEVCDQLSSENKKISVQIVLDRIPSIKSKSTVHPYVRDWRKDKQRRIEAQHKSVVLSDGVMSLLADEVLRHVKFAKDALISSVEKANAQHDEAIDDLKALDENYQCAKSRIQELETELIKVRASLDMENRCLQNALNEGRLTNQKLTCRNQELQRVIENTRIELAKLQGVVATQEAQTLSLEKLNCELEARVLLLEEKLHKRDKAQTSIRLKGRNRK